MAVYKMQFKAMEFKRVDWTELAQDRVQWRAYENEAEESRGNKRHVKRYNQLSDCQILKKTAGFVMDFK